MQHILSARQFDVEQVAQIFHETDALRNEYDTDRRSLASMHIGRTVATLFYEPSTRTRLSFESAAQDIGMGVISTENASEFSSAIKGESIEDTIRTVGAYADVIVLRHKENGLADRAAAASEVPVINAGDGTGEHPTQALLDLYTIQRDKGQTDNLRVVIGGDLKHGRTARSLTQMLSMYEGNHISFVSVPELQMGDDIKAHLDQSNTTYSETDDMYEVLADADVVYWTRLQKERLTNPDIESRFIIDQAALQAMNQDAIILHPLPRVDEIEMSVDTDPRARYFTSQVPNGRHIRRALLSRVITTGEL